MIEILVLFVVGIGVGTFGTLIGIGGGLIMIPLFTFALTPSIFHSAPEIVGTSLFGVFLNALSGTYAYVKQHRVYFKAAIPFAIATLPGAILGSLVSDYFTGPTFSLSYGIFILIISAIMYWNSSNKKAIATNFDETLFITRKKLGIILSMFVGFISSIFGIGGGIIHVPVMIYALAFPPHMATATSHFVLAVSSFMGVTSHIFLNHIVWIPALAVGFGAVIGAQIGARLSKKTKPRSIILLLCISLFLLGIRMIVESNLLVYAKKLLFSTIKKNRSFLCKNHVFINLL